MENQPDSVTEKPIRFLRLPGLARDWSKHNEHSGNIFSVHGLLSLSVSHFAEKTELCNFTKYFILKTVVS